MVKSKSKIKCSLLFKLSRRHGWGSPVSREDLVDKALKSSDQGRGKSVVEELINEPYIGYQRGKGYCIKNDPDSQAQAAFRLVETCKYSQFRVESTLSRFKQAGGFDSYDRDTVLEGLNDW